ncbi:archaellin/type IV pilin N-terminal domain-containing protein, partial [Nanoarchaeota archaeon]
MTVKNSKAMSQIVTTVILVVLVLVAIAIVWAVINNLVGGGAEEVDLGAKCLSVDVAATAVISTTGTSYNVTLQRGAGGDPIGGVKLVFFSDTENSDVLEFTGGDTLTTLATMRA